MRCHAEDDCCGESYGEYRDPHLQLHRLAGGRATHLSATGAWAILVSLDGGAADGSSDKRGICSSWAMACFCKGPGGLLKKEFFRKRGPAAFVGLGTTST